MSYEFRILGPVGLSRGGRPVAGGPPKRMAMLTALLLEPGRPVPLPRLAAALWPGPPPKSAVANLRTHACELRRELPGRLVARPGAYQLGVEDGELDAAEFTRLAQSGREALRAGEPARAIARLGAALALWRGAAGDGVPPGTALDPRLDGLEEQRLDVFDDYVEARLHTGAYREIVADLRRHLARWPVRERAWGLLVQALYRSGNAVGALAAYTGARAALREQLGIEPGRELQDLQRAVLNRAPMPADRPATPVTASGAARSTPRPAPGADPAVAPAAAGAAAALPPDVDRLVGRQAELAAVVAAVRGGHPAVLVYGPAGVGASALATRAARQLAGDFPDGAVAVALPHTRGAPGSAVDAAEAVLAALGQPPGALPSTPQARIAAYRSLTAGRRLLILLDGVAGGRQVRPLLSNGTGPTLLVTGRWRPAGLDGTYGIPLAPLPEPDAVDLLTAYAGADRATRDPAAVRQLARLCHGLPLALRIAGERLARRPELPPALLAEHLAARPLAGLRAGELSVGDALAADHRRVAVEEPVAGAALPLLGQVPPWELTTVDAVADQLGAHPSRVFHALEQLVDAWLVESPRPGAYRAAGLAHAYAADLAYGHRGGHDPGG